MAGDGGEQLAEMQAYIAELQQAVARAEEAGVDVGLAVAVASGPERPPLRRARPRRRQRRRR